MARVTVMCLLLLTSSLQHVTSFAVHRRNSRSTDLADALRMLERQRRRIDREESLLVAAPQLAGGGDRLSLADLKPWFDDEEAASAGSRPASSPNEDDIDTIWLAKNLGLDGFSRLAGGGGAGREGEDLGEEPQVPRTAEFLPDIPVQDPPPVEEEEPSDQELNAIFGEKNDADDTNKEEAEAEAGAVDKKDSEVMTDSKTKSDPSPKAANKRSGYAVVGEAVSSEDTSSDSDDVKLTKEEFKALLKALEKLEKQSIDTAEADAEEVASEIEEKIAEARVEAKVAEEAQMADQDAVAQAMEEAVQEEEAKEEEEEEEAEEQVQAAMEEAAKIQTPKPEPVSNEELDSLFEDHSKEVIPTENGEIVKTESTLRDSEGNPVGKEESVEEVETIPNNGALSSIEDFWYLKKYLDQDGDRKKRNSKRNSYAPVPLSTELSIPGPITSPDTAELLEAYVNKINDLQSRLDQALMVSYLADVENDILTDALNEATVAQIKQRINPAELSSLEDAIRVELALQQVKSNRAQATELAEEFSEELAAEMGPLPAPVPQEKKRGEPWRKRGFPLGSEVPVYVNGDDVADFEDDDDSNAGDDSDDDVESTALALRKWFDKNQDIDLDALFNTPPRDEEAYEMVDSPDDLIRGSAPSSIISLFSDNADQCPAVREFSTNCEFAGDTVDFEARALCNVHELCYVCGHTLEVKQGQCDFIYRAAATMLCNEDKECVTEADVFLNTMKLKHRYVPYSQDICMSRCTAQFLSLV